jgi:hypothetical protein
VSRDDPHPRWPDAFRPISRGAARAVVVLFALSVLLSGAAWWLAVRAVDSGISSRASIMQLCQSGNEARGQQVVLWTHLAAISAPPPRETPAQEKQRQAALTRFLAYIRHVFAPRNCTASLKG